MFCYSLNPPPYSINILQYGTSLVAMDENQLSRASYSPPQILQLLGFTSMESIPRHYFMSHTLIMVANKGDPKKNKEKNKIAGIALAALVQAMEEKESVAIIRFVKAGRNLKVEVLVGQPVKATGATPAHLILNVLPFREDIRTFPFGSFDKDDRRPTQAQFEAALHLVDSMPLKTALNKEELIPQHTATPYLHRLVGFFMGKALDPGTQVMSPEDDVLLQRVLTPAEGPTPGAAHEAAKAAAVQFPTGQHAKALRRAVRKLSPGREEEDFKTMMEQRKCIGKTIIMNVC